MTGLHVNERPGDAVHEAPEGRACRRDGGGEAGFSRAAGYRLEASLARRRRSTSRAGAGGWTTWRAVRARAGAAARAEPEAAGAGCPRGAAPTASRAGAANTRWRG